MIPAVVRGLVIAHSPLSLPNAKLNPICHLLELLGAHHIVQVDRIGVNNSLMFSGILELNGQD